MSVVVSLLIALAVVIALVLGSRLWFDRVQKRAHEQRIGIEVLDTRRWREALDLLVQALAQDGYVQAAEVTGPSGMPLAERHLARGGSRVLLIYKHGTSYHIGAAALLDAERRRQDAEQDEVIIATLGSLDRDAVAQAERMKITCLDGPMVWSRVKPVLDATAREGVATEAEALVERPRRLASIGAAVLGLGIVVWGGGLNDLTWVAESTTMPRPAAAPRVTPAAPSAPPVVSSPNAPAAASAADPAPETTSPSIAEVAPGQDTDDALRRGSAARAVTALPEVERASWSSASTLIVALRPRISIDAGVEKACSLAAEHPVLREVRLQMEASGGGEVRWRRCG